MPTELGFTRAGGSALETVNDLNPLPVNPAAATSTADSYLARLGDAKTVSAQGVSTATGSVAILSYTVPSGCLAYVPNVIIINLGGTPPTMRVRYTPIGGIVEVIAQQALSATTYTAFAVALYMAAGDTIDWFVSAGGAGSTANAVISVLQTSII